MNTEQKAKAYDEAVNKIKPLYEQAKRDGNPIWSTYEYLIPELCESEDERIRKALIDALKVSETIGELKFKLPYPTREECIAYLEKQKNLDKMIVVSPEVWDGAINDAYENGKKDSEKQKEQKPLSTEETELNSLAFLEQIGYTCIPPKKEHQNNSDAPKNALGGALNSPLDKDKNLDDIAQDYVEAVKEYNPEPTWNLMQTAVCYGYHYREEEEQKPAEWKPQPESLEALMYAIEGKWDMISPTSYLSRRLEDLYDGLVNTYNVDESLLDELPKVASRAYTAEDIEELKELKKKIDASMDEKSAEWSEKDEEMLDAMIDIVSNSLYEPLCPREGMLDWLKSLPLNLKKKNEDVAKLCSNEWSEDDEKIRKWCISHFKECFHASKDNLEFKQYLNNKIIPWLNSTHPLPKQIISEDTEVLMAKLVNLLKSYRIGEETATTLANRIADTYGTQRYMDGLCDGEKLHWKPSEEQIKAIESCFCEFGEGCPDEDGLRSLYNDLKKLM